MSSENVELVRKAWQGFGVGSLEEVAQTYWHPDVEYAEDPRWPGASRYKGRDEVLRCFQAYMEVLGDAENAAVEVDQIFDAGERQVIFVHFQGRSASGVPHEHLWGYVVETRDGFISYFGAYYEPLEALKTVGLDG